MTLALADLVDESTFPPQSVGGELELDQTGRRITGARVVLEWVVRAWLSPRGALPHARGRGVDVRGLENASLDAATLQSWRTALIAEARTVEYVRGCAVTISRRGRTTAIEGGVQLVDGRTYSLAVLVGEAARVAVEIGGLT